MNSLFFPEEPARVRVPGIQTQAGLMSTILLEANGHSIKGKTPKYFHPLILSYHFVLRAVFDRTAPQADRERRYIRSKDDFQHPPAASRYAWQFFSREQRHHFLFGTADGRAWGNPVDIEWDKLQPAWQPDPPGRSISCPTER